MKEFTIAHPVELIESLMNEVGYPTRTKARNALKRGEILVNGAPEVKGNLVLEPGVTVSVLDAKDASKLSRVGGVKARRVHPIPNPRSRLRTPWYTRTTLCLSTKNLPASFVQVPIRR